MKIRRISIMVVAIVLFFSILTMPQILKKDIATATVQEISMCDNIGDKLATEIKVYVESNNIGSIDDLHIKYIGDKRKEELKKKFR